MSVFPGSQPDAEHPIGVLLVGGPCAGMLRYVSVHTATTGHIRCQGATYVPDPNDTNWPPQKPYTTERWVPNWQAARIARGEIPKVTRNVSAAWARLMRVFAHTGPRAVNRTRAATARMERLTYVVRRRH